MLTQDKRGLDEVVTLPESCRCRWWEAPSFQQKCADQIFSRYPS